MKESSQASLELHLMNIKRAKSSGFIRFRFADKISVAVLKERSIEPDEAATPTASLPISLKSAGPV